MTSHKFSVGDIIYLRRFGDRVLFVVRGTLRAPATNEPCYKVEFLTNPTCDYIVWQDDMIT